MVVTNLKRKNLGVYFVVIGYQNLDDAMVHSMKNCDLFQLIRALYDGRSFLYCNMVVT